MQMADNISASVRLSPLLGHANVFSKTFKYASKAFLTHRFSRHLAGLCASRHFTTWKKSVFSVVRDKVIRVGVCIGCVVFGSLADKRTGKKLVREERLNIFQFVCSKNFREFRDKI